MTPILSSLLVLALLGAPAGAESPWLAEPPGAADIPPPAALDPEVPSPASILGYAPGERFTPYHRLLQVIDGLAQASDRLRVETYGTTTEGRPLRWVVVSSPRHLERLDTILDRRRQAVEQGDEALLDGLPAVVWLGFGVHGNETSSSEAAMAILHLLAAAEPGSPPARWLDRLVVVVDPVSNPDGRERYVQWFRSVRGSSPDADGRSLEHHEPWPGGRQNHYLFDLNRDWAWATQVETRARLVAFQRFAPDVLVDVHEMRPDATYFFAPPAEPVHPRIPASTRDALATFGRANAEAFDRRAWPFFVREVYDFFYPGYGDTYPSLTGAIGMTYEMAGGGRAGSELDLDDGRRRTLAGRTARHTVAVLSTLATAAADPRGLALDTWTRRREVEAGSYVWAADQPEARALAELLRRHGIPVGRLGTERALDVAPILPGDPVRRRFDADTYVAASTPPTGRLLHALMERQPELAKAFVERQRRRAEQGLGVEIYDITAWSLPLAYGVETWHLDGSLETEPLVDDTPSRPSAEAAIQGWLMRPRGLRGYRFIAQLLDQDLRLRRLVEPESSAVPGGSVFVPRQANPSDLDRRVERAVESTGVRIEAVDSAWLDGAPSMGSRRWRPHTAPRVGLIAGRGIDVTAHGHLWHLFDQQLDYPISRLDQARLDEHDLDGFDVLILPDGDYESSAAEPIETWLRDGGTVIAIAGAADWAQGLDWSSLEVDESDRPSGAERALIEVPGAIVATRLSPASRLAVGLATPPAVLYRGSRAWPPSGDPHTDVLTIRETSPVLAGLVWPEAEERLAGTLLVADESFGRGRLVTFAVDPAFRGFWRATLPILLDAVFFSS